MRPAIVELRLCLLERGAERQPGQDLELAALAWKDLRPDGHRDPEIGAEDERARRHHADQRVRLAVDEHRPADDRRIAGEARLPQPMADHGHPLAALDLLRAKPAAGGRLDAQGRERVAPPEGAEGVLGDVAHRELPVSHVPGHDILEVAASLLDVQVLGR